MEEVDNIIIHTLRQIGCEVDDSIDSLKQFNTELIVEATAKCIRVIKPNVEVSHRLPPSMSARFKVGSVLAQLCTDLGYQGEIGYQTFLYSGEGDIRKVFMFLIEKLPKETEKSMDEPLGGSALLSRTISSELSRRLQMPWIPRFCKSKGVRRKDEQWIREGTSYTYHCHSMPLSHPHGLEDLSRRTPKEVKNYYTTFQPLVTEQVRHFSHLAPSLFELNASRICAAHEWDNEWNQVGLPSRLSKQEFRSRKRQKIQKKIADVLNQEVQKAPAEPSKDLASTDLHELLTQYATGKKPKDQRTEDDPLTQEAAPSPVAATGKEEPAVSLVDQIEEKRQSRLAELQNLQTELDNATAQLETLQLEAKKFTGGIQQMEEKMALEREKNKEVEDSFRVKKRTLDLLPDADNNMAKLQSLVETSTQRLISLANQWEKHRAPLIEQYRKLKEVNVNKLSETQRKLEEIKSIRDKIRELADDARHKEELHKQLLSEYEKTTKDVNRAAYTRRILEIVGNIKKQKEDIDKVLIDTKEVQKEINQLTGKLDRTFTVTDELVFRDAKKDESVRKAYKFLAALHESCSLLIKTVEETGAIMREIRDLEDQIETESQKKTLSNLERIMADYKQMKNENAALVGKLKEAGQT